MAMAAPVVAALPATRDTREQNTRDDANLVPQLEALLQLLPTFAERAVYRAFPGLTNGGTNGNDNGNGNGNGRNNGTRRGRARTQPNSAAPFALPEFDDGLPSAEELLDVAGRIGLFAVDALTPWDYDRHDFGVTFAHTWEESELLPRVWRAAGVGRGDAAQRTAIEGGSSGSARRERGNFGGGGSSNSGSALATNLVPTQVKVTSTVKPVEGEWKVTARTKLWHSGDGDGVLFGKAGMFLAGKGAPYIGVEADRVWALPLQLPLPQRAGGSGRTKVFANVNYRSSRAPRKDPVRWSFGLQHDFALGRGLDVTLRVGLHPFEKRKLFATPVPNGRYY